MPQIINPTLFIGLGGTGHLFTSNIKDIIARTHLGNRPWPFPLVKYLVIDSEFISIPYKDRQVTEGEKEALQSYASSGDRSYEQTTKSVIEFHEQVEIGVLPPELEEQIEHPERLGLEDFMPSDRGEIRPGAFGASQVGLLGKLMGVLKFKQIYESILTQIQYLTGEEIGQDVDDHWSEEYQRSPHRRLSVYISCSLGGGTGRGLHLLVAAMVRAAMRGVSTELEAKAKIFLVNFLPECFETPGRIVPAETLGPLKANEYAAFKELDHILIGHASGKEGELRMERYFNTNLGQVDRIQLRLFDSILLLSPKLEGGAAHQLDSYQLINDIVGKAIASIIFSDFQGDFEAAMSNKRRPIEEAKTGAERPRMYARIGRGALRYPVRRIRRFMEAYVSYHALMDLEDGHLTIPPEVHDEQIASQRFTRLRDHAGQRFPTPPGLTFDQLGENTYETPFDSRVQDRLQRILSSLKANHAENEKSLVGAPELTEPSYFDTELVDLRSSLVEEIRAHGIRRARGIIEKLLVQMDAFEQEAMTRNRSRLKLSELQGDALRKALNDFITELENDGSQLYVDGSHPGFGAIRKSLERDQDEWKKRRTWLAKIGVSEPEPKFVSEETKKAVGGLVSQFFKDVIRPLHAGKKLMSYLRFFDKLRAALQKLSHGLDVSRSILSRQGERSRTVGLVVAYEQRMTDVAREPRNPTDFYVFGRNKNEFLSFCDRFEGRNAVFDGVQRLLNERIVPALLDADLTEVTLRGTLDVAVHDEVERATKSLSITSFFEDLYRDNRSEEIERFWTALHQQASWLGVIEQNRVGQKNRQDTDFKPFGFLEIAKPELFRGSNAARALFGLATNTKVVQQTNLDEEIILTRYQAEMPLFVFDSVHDARKDYNREVRSETHFAKSLALLGKFHTSRQFFFVEEPIDTPLVIPAAEKATTLNLMLHLGVIRIDDDGYLECLQKREGQVQPVLRRWLLRDTDFSSAVYFEEFLRAGVDGVYGDLVQHLFEVATARFTRMMEAPLASAEQKRALEDAVKGYLTDSAWPPVPAYYMEARLRRVSPALSRLYTRDDIVRGYRQKVAAFRKTFPEPAAYRDLDTMVREMGLVTPPDFGALLWTSARTAPTPTPAAGAHSASARGPEVDDMLVIPGGDGDGDGNGGRADVRPAAAAPRRTLKEELLDLKDLADMGLISQEQFEQKRDEAMRAYKF